MIRLSRQHTINFILLFWGIIFPFMQCLGESTEKRIKIGAEQYNKYLPYLTNKKVGLVVNQTSLVGDVHLVDFLISKKIEIKTIFAPEHGYKGNQEAGDIISNSKDSGTGINVISLYGEKKKPYPSDVKDLDIIVFDLQDVGCRFFTYISTMHYVMESCAENNIPIIILDRPNPNGDYVDGPILKMELISFVGMHPIPIVHGCTIGELALMINSEGWLRKGKICSLKVIPVINYSHKDIYEPPVNPSPNLPNITSIRLYPSLCLFESTNISIGRGTKYPFQIIGYPDQSFGDFCFIPEPIKGVSENPLHSKKECFGIDLRDNNSKSKFTISYFLDFYNKFENKELFWSSKKWVSKLTGDPDFYNDVTEGMREEDIRKKWEQDLYKYKIMRRKYLLYPDFE